MLKRNIKAIASLVIGIPAAMMACGEAHSEEGFALQLIALAVLAGVLAINGAFSRKEVVC